MSKDLLLEVGHGEITGKEATAQEETLRIRDLLASKTGLRVDHKVEALIDLHPTTS